MVKHCWEKLCIAIERCSNSSDTQQTVIARNIMAAISRKGGEANSINDKSQSAKVVLDSLTPPAPYLLPYAKMYFTVAITECDVRAAYAKLRELMSGASPPDAKRTDIETKAELIRHFFGNNLKDPNTWQHLGKYAEEALAEGHVELFEKAADWCRLFSAKEQSDLEPWRQCLWSLYLTINYRSHNSLKLAKRLAKSKHYIRMEEMAMSWIYDDEDNLVKALRNNLSLLNCAPDASVTFRRLDPLILEIYNTKK